MASHVPVIVTDRAALARDIAAAQAGLVVQSSEAIASALLSLLADSDRRATLAEKGRLFVSQSFDWHRIVPQLINLYERCIATASPFVEHGDAPAC